MENKGRLEGFEEVSHTADWALKVWAPSLSALYRQAALGMYSLMGLVLSSQIGDVQSIVLEAGDDESLLVNFLAELLYWTEEERIGFSTLKVTVNHHQIVAVGETSPIGSLQKEIKAVTFHNLAIQENDGWYVVTIVFDV